MHRLKSLSLSIVFVVLLSSVTNGQWRHVANFGIGIGAIYFLDHEGTPNVGFVSVFDINNLMLQPALWRTSDIGKTWTKIDKTPAGCAFTFKDSITGWMATRNGHGGCYQTTDGGNTWFEDPSKFGGEGIWYNSVSHLLLLGSWVGGVYSSSDEGATWVLVDSIEVANGLSFGGTNGLIGIVTGATIWSTLWDYTTDGGFTWQHNISNIGSECWQPHVIPGTSTCFAWGEFSGGGFLRRSDDGGISWRRLNPRIVDATPGPATGTIDGDLCCLYAQTFGGVLVSKRQGLSWDFIAGPGNFWDTRFYVNGRTIYAGDTIGNLWVYTDSVPLYNQVALNLDSTFVNFDTLGNCQSKEYIVHFSNYLHCDSIAIASMVWDTTNPAIQLVNQPKYPHVLQPEQQDSLVFRYTPIAGGKTSVASLRLKIVLGGVEHDTVISLTGSSFVTPRATLSSASLNFDTLSTCDTGVRMFTISNASCDSINVSLTSSPSGGFSFVTPWNNYKIAGGETDTFRVSLHSFLQLQFVPLIGSPYGNTLNLLGTVIPGSASISLIDTTINFGSISICSNATLPAFFTSTGCDSLRVSGEVLSAGVLSSGFSVLNAHSGSLAVGAKDSVLVKFVPPGVRKFYDTLWVSTNAEVRKVYVSGQGTADPGKIVLSDTSLTFGTVTASCDSSARVFRFVNTTCNTITVDSATARVTDGTYELPFGLKGTASGTLAPRDSESFALSFIPGLAGAYSGVVTVYYHGLDNVEHDTSITLAGIAVAAPTIGVAMKPGSYSASALGTIDIPLYLTGSLDQASSQSIGLQTLDIVLAMNTDLLTPLTANPLSPNIPLIPVQITGKNSVTLPVTLPANFTFSDSTELLTLHCQAFVTDTMQTAIALQSAEFVAKTASACFTQRPANGTSSFSLIARCEDSVLTGDLAHGLSFVVQSIVPNPTSGKLTVNLSGPSDLWVLYDLYDLLGRAVMHGGFAGSANSLDVGSLGSGSYYLRLTSGGEVVSRKVVVRR